jgi:hypothetical protein
MVEPAMRQGVSRRRGRPARPRRGAALFGVCTVVALLIVPFGDAARATTISVNCATGGDLQAKLDGASSGSTILVKGTCLGRFVIDGKSLTVKGNPTATLDGDDLGRTLEIDNTAGKSIHLIGLTITGGEAVSGGGVSKQFGLLTLKKTRVVGNLVQGTGQLAGGGIYSSNGNLTLIDSTVAANRVLSTGFAPIARGGGISVHLGTLTITNSTISDNRVTAHAGSGTSHAFGGGFYIENGDLVVQGSTISGNRLTAFSDGDAEARGAAGEQLAGSTASISGSAITRNAGTAHSDSGSTDGGQTLLLQGTSQSITGSTLSFNTGTMDAPNHAANATGGAISGTTLEVTSSEVVGNKVRATGDSQSTASAGGVEGSAVTVTRSTIGGNAATAIASAGTADATGGGLEGSNVAIHASTVSRNVVTGRAHGANNAGATGGGIYQGNAQVTNSTIALNRAIAAAPDPGGHAQADGGGLYEPFSSSSLIDTTVAANTASASGNTSVAEAGGLDAVNSGVTIEATIVANNVATVAPDCAGDPTSNGHNLIRKLTGCSLVPKSTDVVGKDPRLGALAGNGGPTQTMAIASTSPALDRIPAAACAVAEDQRGVSRPQGPKCDIGAYERKPA